MNNTNRAVNRTLLLVVGMILLAVGAAALLLAVWPDANAYSRTAGPDAQNWLVETDQATAIGAGPASWLAIGTLAIVLALIALLVVILARLGGRRPARVLRTDDADSELGRVTVRESFAADALKAALADRHDVIAVRVTANEVRREPVLHVSVTPRQTVSPRDLADHIDGLLRNLATLTGRSLPTYVSIRSGIRARFTPDQRRLF